MSQVLRGISFLNLDAGLRHNGLHGEAIFVTKVRPDATTVLLCIYSSILVLISSSSQSGDWKLFGLDRVTPSDPGSHAAAPRLQALQRYEPPEAGGDPAKARAATAWSRDMWGAGCVLWEVYNGPLPSARSLGQLGSIPKRLSQLYMELVAANPAKRPNPRSKSEELRRQGGCFKNRLVDAMLTLEEIHLKDEAEKAR